MDKRCLACQRGSAHVPLVTLEYRDTTLWICVEHLPILIHNPAQLMDKLPGVENLSPGEPAS